MKVILTASIFCSLVFFPSKSFAEKKQNLSGDLQENIYDNKSERDSGLNTSSQERKALSKDSYFPESSGSLGLRAIEISPKNVLGDSADKLEKAVIETETFIPQDSKMIEALQIINKNINSILSGEPANLDKIFLELRKIFAQEEFSNGELLEFIDDATEIRRKYHLILDCMARVEFAKRSVKYGIAPRVALQLASSEYIQLPNFILKEGLNDNEFNKMVSDVGCGVVWKDRLKYLFALNRYFGNGSNLKIEDFKHFPNRIRNYIKLLEENDKFCQKFFYHLRYVMAQDFYYAGISKENIVNIFSLSEEEWRNFVKPGNYNR